MAHIESLNLENLQISVLEQETKQRPMFPEFAFESARKRSFDEWPSSIKQNPDEMCDAGFFYTQRGDCVRCFSCGGGLRDWIDGDIPWEHHALWFSECNYLISMKGKEYINQIKSNQRINLEEDEIRTSSKQEISQSEQNEIIKQNLEEEFCDAKKCKLCYLNEYNTVFIPCGHIIACMKCASALTNCPVCRETFQSAIRIYFS